MKKRIAFCVSVYDRDKDFNLLTDLLQLYKEENPDWDIRVYCCCSHPKADQIRTKLEGFDKWVPFPTLNLKDSDNDLSRLNKNIFNSIRATVKQAFADGASDAIFLHSDVYPLSFTEIERLIHNLQGRLVALRGYVPSWGGFWMDDNIIFFNRRIMDRYPQMLELNPADDRLCKSFFSHEIHHFLPFWLLGYLEESELYVFSHFEKSVGVNDELVGAVADPLNYDPVHRILHANNCQFWCSPDMAFEDEKKRELFIQNNILKGPRGIIDKFVHIEPKRFVDRLKELVSPPSSSVPK